MMKIKALPSFTAGNSQIFCKSSFCIALIKQTGNMANVPRIMLPLMYKGKMCQATKVLYRAVFIQQL